MNFKKLDQLKKSGQWMVRTDNDGISYKNFQWSPVGEWTIAKDWNPSPVCGGGLHGQGPGGFGCAQPGTRFTFCETENVVSINGDKIKCKRAKILYTDKKALIALFYVSAIFPGSLDLHGYQLPEGLKLPESVGGSLYLEGCQLPEGLKLPESVGKRILI